MSPSSCPFRGEDQGEGPGLAGVSGQGLTHWRKAAARVTPHPSPLPGGEREHIASAGGFDSTSSSALGGEDRGDGRSLAGMSDQASRPGGRLPQEWPLTPALSPEGRGSTSPQPVVSIALLPLPSGERTEVRGRGSRGCSDQASCTGGRLPQEWPLTPTSPRRGVGAHRVSRWFRCAPRAAGRAAAGRRGWRGCRRIRPGRSSAA